MNKNANLWNDAAKYGALIALAWIGLQILGMYTGTWMVSLAVFVVLLYLFTRRRAALYGAEEGYSYGSCLVYILCMMLFAGILGGAYEIVASTWLFADKYAEATAKTVVMLENTGFYTDEQIDMVTGLTRSPLVILFSNIFRAVVKGLFFGLFVAAMTKRAPNLFAQNDSDDANA